MEIKEEVRKVKLSAPLLAGMSEEKRNHALQAVAEALISAKEEIFAANAQDMEQAEKDGIAAPVLKRLKFDEGKLHDVTEGIRDLIRLKDPLFQTQLARELDEGLTLYRVTCPIGVIGVIFEARPNVTSDAAALCLKSGNTVILRGGKEAINSNKTIAKVMRQAVKEAGMPEDVIQLVEDTSRESANELMKMNEYVDVLIPRGGAGLIQAVVKNATVPVIETGVGNCHIYIDKNADLKKAVDIVFNAKTSRPSVCNAAESLLIHKDIAKEALVAIKNKLDEKDVTLVGDSKAREIIPDMEKATDADWATEYLDYKMSVKIVDSVEEAIDHIYKYSTGHSECIVTENAGTAEKFMNQVDSAAVYLNASTRFTVWFRCRNRNFHTETSCKRTNRFA